MEICVRQQHIDEAKRRSDYLNPIALAVLDHLHPSELVKVSREVVHVYKKDFPADYREVATPLVARDILNVYNLGIPIKPFNFELNV